MENAQHNTRYIDSGRRFSKEKTVGGDFLNYFHPTKGRTFDEVTDDIIASNWKPPNKAGYDGRAAQVKYIRGYLTWLVRNKYLVSE